MRHLMARLARLFFISEARTYVAGLAAVMLLMCGCSGVSQSAKELVGVRAPYTRFTMLDGQPLPLEFARGKTIGVLFWTTWCGHSRSAIDDFEDLARRYARRKDIVFLAVSLDKPDQLREVQRRIQQQKLSTIQHAFSGNEIYDEAYIALRGEQVPYVVVIDHSGMIQSVSSSTSALKDYLRQRYR